MSSDISAVREEDSFDIEVLHSWLRRHLSELSSLPEVEQFRSGASNLTYLIRYPDRQLVLRRPPRGTKAVSAHDMKREFQIQQKLKPFFPLVPSVIAFCEDPSILGSDFYIMEKINGTILRRDLPEGVSISSTQAADIGEKLISALVELHSVDSAFLSELNKGPGYVERQVLGWSHRYRNSRTSDVPQGDELMNWLDSHQPKDVAARVIHGDWRLDNIVLDIAEHSRVVGVLDWELATVGDPLMDLGSALAYWVDRNDEPAFAGIRRQPSHLPGMPTRTDFINTYLSKTNFRCDDFTFYEVFGLFRLAVIAQQIWARYKLGQTTNPAFSELGSIVTILLHRALERTL